MISHRSALIAASLFLLPAAAAGQVIEVAFEDNLQAAIDAAPAGATLFVTGGPRPSIVINKPLTLVGGWYEGDASGHHSFVILSGPGHGRVVLANIQAVATHGGCCISLVQPGIRGGGFDELHITDSLVRAPEIRPYDGRAYGVPALVTNIPFVVIERSTLSGSRTDDSEFVFAGADGPPGIDAPASTLLVLDSTIQGGPSGDFTIHPKYERTCEEVCAGGPGAGGPGIVAARLFHSDSSIQGGDGATFRAFLEPGGAYAPCPCTGQDGAPLQLSSVPLHLPSRLHMPAPPHLGDPLELTFDGPGPAQLFASFGLTRPRRVPGAGLLFLQAPDMRTVLIQPGTTSFAVPPGIEFLGRALAFQALDSRRRLSRPVLGVISW